METDVTDKVETGEVDDECMPVKKCVCGATFPNWNQLLSIYPDDPWECPHCHAKLYFRCRVIVFKIEP